MGMKGHESEKLNIFFMESVDFTLSIKDQYPCYRLKRLETIISCTIGKDRIDMIFPVALYSMSSRFPISGISQVRACKILSNRYRRGFSTCSSPSAM
jgi:hypothetical protein